MAEQTAAAMRVYVGTYTATSPHAHGKSEGIYTNQFDPASGRLTRVHTTSGVVNPSYLALDPRHRYLYAVDEVEESDGQPTGGVSAFAVDSASGALTFLNRQPSHGTAPCHVSVDRTGRFVLVANYGSGSVAMYPIEDGGGLGAASDVVQHVGSSVNPERQQGPHAHSINLDPDNHFALVCDLGMDKIMVYRLDLAHGKLVPNDPPSAAAKPGAGPRHLAFHPNARNAYVINEIASTLTAFAWDGARGALREIQTVSTLPVGFTGSSHTADVHVAPSGRFVYGSNRGHDSIVGFAIDQQTGALTYAGHASTLGRTPRNFAIDPSGTFLLVANQDTDTVVTFRVDPETGQLSPTGQMANVPTPVCLKFA